MSNLFDRQTFIISIFKFPRRVHGHYWNINSAIFLFFPFFLFFNYIVLDDEFVYSICYRYHQDYDKDIFVGEISITETWINRVGVADFEVLTLENCHQNLFFLSSCIENETFVLKCILWFLWKKKNCFSLWIEKR